MKMKIFLPLFALVCAACGVAQSSNYTPQDAAKHVGETCTIIGTVDGFKQSKGRIFLDMGGRYPNQAFTAYIPPESAAQFADAAKYEGRTISVSGTITLYKGRPEIKVNSPSQITVK
jgi:hypothetical protein